MDEVWKDIPGYEGRYQASSLGRVRSLITDRILRETKQRTGYTTLCLGRKNTVTVHVAVCSAFHGPKPDGMDVCRHLDGDPTNNRASNLAWGTYKDNESDKRRHGRICAGERCGKSKLTEDQVRTIMDRAANGYTIRQIAAEFGLASNSVIDISKGRVWRHVVGSGFPIVRADRKLLENDVRDIYLALAAGVRPSVIAEHFGVSSDNVLRIRSGATWTHLHPGTKFPAIKRGPSAESAIELDRRRLKQLAGGAS